MDEIVNIYKPQGMTPLQLIESLRKQNSKYKDVKIGFAGRLDPLAHGLMLLTVGEKNKTRQSYLVLNKTYKFSVLFGVETDTYDYLGIIKKIQSPILYKDLNAAIKNFTRVNTGKFTQPYPPFSSKTLNGTPLFKLAKKGKLKLGDVPSKEIEIFKFKLLGIKSIKCHELQNPVLENLRKIKGYFRQKRIIRQWEKFFSESPKQEFVLANFEIECSSGTYVRSLAHKMGQELGMGAIAFEILRIQVGDYKLKNALKLPQ